MNDNIEPQRLLDDPNVLGSLRGDLNAAAGAAPLRYDVEAGLARFQAQLAQVSAAGTGAATGSSLAIGKVVAGVAGLLVVGGAAWALLTGGPTPSPEGQGANHPEAVAVAPALAEPQGEGESAPPAVASPVASAEAPAPMLAADEVTPAETEAVAEPVAEPPVAAPAEEPEPRASTRSKRHETDEGAADHTSDFLREARKVQQAKKALDADPTRTLRLLREVEREFPNGQLTEEREGLYVLALLGTGKNDEGKRRADAYLARHPRGTLATRVRRALAQLP